MSDFYGRKEELRLLSQQERKATASLIVIRGRRRIGKTRLTAEFAMGKRVISMSGMPPDRRVTAQQQRETFAHQMTSQLGMPYSSAPRWSTLFWQLAQQTNTGPVVMVFDEISWMGSKDRNFLGELKTAWDSHFSKNPDLILVLCGSVSSWIQKNILSSTGFLGRISVDLQLGELPITDCRRFWRDKLVSPQEVLRMLSVTGGVPKYLEEVIPEMSSLQNIQRLCFRQDGILRREFDQIFSDLFGKHYETYRRIAEALADGPLALQDLCDRLGLTKSGSVSACLANLKLAGFIADDPCWNIKTGKLSSLKKFRLSDNYLRFYLKVIAPTYQKSNRKNFTPSSSVLTASMGLQFENLVLNNVETLLPSLDLEPSQVSHAGPYFQRATKRVKGCQVDLMIQTTQRAIYVCEVKSSEAPLGVEVVNVMRERVKSLSVPNGFSIHPVLIHTSTCSPSVKETGLFDYVIDYTQLL